MNLIMMNVMFGIQDVLMYPNLFSFFFFLQLRRAIDKVYSQNHNYQIRAEWVKFVVKFQELTKHTYEVASMLGQKVKNNV